ncbi:uncharacterized protein [Malus domestica]|uniref:uncharacterized protein n=1 Tax=Malus domestica TaxID=3750 RepID=UPI003975F23E
MGKDLAKLFQKYAIKQHMFIPRYPQDNRQAKGSNKMVLNFLKKSLPTRRENGQTNSPDVYGHIAPPKDEQPNSKEMATSLDLADEKRGQTITRIVAYQQHLLSSYNKRAKIRLFQPEDLVLRKSFIIARKESSKKMDPIWEGPYKISRVGGKSNYTLATKKQQNDKKNSRVPII